MMIMINQKDPLLMKVVIQLLSHQLAIVMIQIIISQIHLLKVVHLAIIQDHQKEEII